MPIILLGLLYLTGLTAFNAGVVVFTLTTIVNKSMRWWARILFALTGFIVVFIASWVALKYFVNQDSSNPLSRYGIIAFIIFHASALIAIGATIAWLVRRKATGFKVFMKTLATACAAIGMVLTGMTVMFFISTFNHSVPSLYQGIANGL